MSVPAKRRSSSKKRRGHAHQALVTSKSWPVISRQPKNKALKKKKS